MPNWKALSPTSRHEFNVAIVCANPSEYDALCILLDGFWDEDGDLFGRAEGDPNTYTTGHIGTFNIVVVLLYNSGRAIAASTVASLRSSYPRLELLFLTGVCDCVPAAKHLVDVEPMQGDVIIGDTVIQYDLGNIYSDRYWVSAALESRTSRANKNIRSFIKVMNTELWNQRLATKTLAHLQQIQARSSQSRISQRHKKTSYEYPGIENDILFEPTYCHKHYGPSQCECINHANIGDPVCDDSRELSCAQTGCEYIRRVHRNRAIEDETRHDQQEITQQPRIVFGKFGSGDAVIRSGIIRDRIAEKYEITAFEVEGAGVWDELPCIIVKGVSGYGDGHRTDSWSQWQDFAAATSASAAKSLIESYIHTDKSSTSVALDQANLEYLGDLFITNPRDDKTRIEDTKGGLLVDAYKWILDNDAYNRWRQGPESLLWIKGDPGKGKTMLLCGIIDELEKITSCSIYYFFCQATDSRLDNATAILRGLLYMMIRRHPPLISYVRTEYNQYGKSVFEDSNSFIALSRIFCNILENATTMVGDPSAAEFIIVIDALDECKTNLPQVLNLIVQCTSKHATIKWILSSRNERDIQEVLAKAEQKSTISLELNEDSVSDAIDTYIRYNVQSLAQEKGYDDETRHGIENCLFANADGTFLWVALVCAQLKRVSRFDARRKAAAFPPGLDQFYDRMIQKICDLDQWDLGRKVLSIAAVARRPLTIQEFVPLINGADGHDASDYDWDIILGYCGSFLTLRHDTIYFIHQSASDFLTEHTSNRLFPHGTEAINRYIFKNSLLATSQALGKKDMYGLVNPGSSIDDLKCDPSNSGPLASVAYCCVYWIHHFERATSASSVASYLDIEESHKVIYNFIETKFIYWLEALSLLRSVFGGMTAIQKLKKIVGDSKAHELKRLVWDANRFIQMYGKVIADFPLQVYVSGLFSPKYSLIRQCFETEVPESIQLWPDRKTGWSRCLRRFEGHEGFIRKLAISSRGTWLASYSKDGTIKIWNASSGKVMQSLSASSTSDSEELISFSPSNDNEFAFGNVEELQIVIWDVIVGKVIHNIKLEGINIPSVGLRLSYIKEDLIGCHLYGLWNSDASHHVSIWNTKTGQRTKSTDIALPPIKVRYLIDFSPKNSNVIAITPTFSGSMPDFETGFSIGHLDTSNQVRTIRYYDCPKIFTSQFSPSGHLLVVHYTESFTTSITMFDITAGVIKWAIPVNVDPLPPVLAFSAEERFAVGDCSKLEIRDTVSGRCLHEVKAKCQALAFPIEEDGQVIFVGRGYSTSLIEFGTREPFPPAVNDDKLEMLGVFDFAMSPDGEKIVALSTIPTPRIMLSDTDFINPICIGHAGKNYSLGFKFSSDSSKLACVLDGRLEVWDISSNASRRIFSQRHYPNAARFSMAFSPDSQSLAVADSHFEKYVSLENTIEQRALIATIEIWDIASSRRLVHLEKSVADSFYEFLLAFSSNSSLLAISWICWSRGIVKIELWDTISGTGIRSKELCHADFNHSPSSFTEDSVKLKELSFTESGDIILDLYCCHNIRAVLRINATNLEPTSVSEHQLPRTKKERYYSVDPSGCWITHKGENILWIPPELGCNSDSWDSQANRVAISDPVERRLSIFKFCCGICPKQMFTSDNAKSEKTCPHQGQSSTYTRELNDWQIQEFNMEPPKDMFTIIRENKVKMHMLRKSYSQKVSTSIRKARHTMHRFRKQS